MTNEQIVIYVILPVAGYLLGSMPFGWIIGKMNGVDIRTVGSKNIGATNLGRTLGKRFFWYAFLLDAAKGFFPVLIAALVTHRGMYVAMGSDGQPLNEAPGPHPFGVIHYTLPSWAPLLTAIACVLGHTFPVWLKFKGGKGVATSFGVVLGFWPLYTLAGIGGGLVFVFVLMVYRYISLSSIMGVTAFAVLVMMMGMGRFDTGGMRLSVPWGELEPLVIVAWLFTALIVIKHRANISRLMKGTEPKVGQKQIEKAQMDK